MNAPVQQEMIETVRQLSRQDDRLVAALMYGSFTKGEGDRYSDIEFYLFVRDDELDGLDEQTWVSQIAPLAAFFVNEFGSEVAIFENLVRGEFHFEPASRMEQVRGWGPGATSIDPNKMILLDHTGELRDHLDHLKRSIPVRTSPAYIQELVDRYLNWMLLGANVLRRGERARALDSLGHIHRYLLWMVRLAEGHLEHWPTPSKGLELDISPAAYRRFMSCTAGMQAAALENAYLASWSWGRELITMLSLTYAVPIRQTLIERIDQYINVSSG